MLQAHHRQGGEPSRAQQVPFGWDFGKVSVVLLSLEQHDHATEGSTGRKHPDHQEKDAAPTQALPESGRFEAEALLCCLRRHGTDEKRGRAIDQTNRVLPERDGRGDVYFAFLEYLGNLCQRNIDIRKRNVELPANLLPQLNRHSAPDAVLVLEGVGGRSKTATRRGWEIWSPTAWHDKVRPRNTRVNSVSLGSGNAETGAEKRKREGKRVPKEKTNTRGMLLKRATLQLPVRGRTRAGRRNLTRARNLRRPPWPARMPTSVGSDVRQTILRIRSTARELDLVAARALPHDQRNVLVVLFSKPGACLDQVSSPKPRSLESLQRHHL